MNDENLQFEEMGLIEESPIPDTFAPDPEDGYHGPGVGSGAEVIDAASEVIGVSGVAVVEEPATPPPKRSSGVSRGSGLPDPNQVVPRPEPRQPVDYEAAAQGGTRTVRTRKPTQTQVKPEGTPQQGEVLVSQPTEMTQRPVNRQNPAVAGRAKVGVPAQTGVKRSKPVKQQAPVPPMRGGNGGGAQAVVAKRKSLPWPIFAAVGVVLLAVIAFVAFRFINVGAEEPELVPVVQNYETSGRWALDTLKSAINSYAPEELDKIVGTESGDSYLAQEWAYVNNVKIRQEFIQKVGALVQFEYPKEPQLATNGMAMTDSEGHPIMIESYMNGGEEFKVTIPDYAKIASTMDEKQEYIRRMLASAKYTPKDYTWVDELTNLMLQFVLDDEGGYIPTKQVGVVLPIRLSVNGQPYIETDAVLDDLLFGSEDFHYMMAKFSQICTGWTGYVDETYLTYERRHNDEYDKWLELFLMYFEADGGVYDPNGDPQFTNVQKAFNKNRSKWEPWYLRDANNVIQTYDDGTYIVNYFSVKDANGNDWIQPAAEIEIEVEKVRQREDPWVNETGIWYSWIGQHFLETYEGPGSTVVRVGDGSREYPAGIGTTIITRVYCTDGKYHDVRVAMLGYWTEQSAIDYAEKFSSKNRGFTTSSPVKLICYEIYVENLEDVPIEFESSEMTLTDRNSNLSSRTGTMYAFTGVVKLEPAGSKDEADRTILNDWATSTELYQKYVCWGKTFGRQFNMVYFDCLAGTGDIPPYSAYKAFSGKSSIDPTITK